jgi:cell surface protein SprA
MEDYNGALAPGIPFIMGIQDSTFADYAVTRGWLTEDQAQNNAMTMTHTNNLNIRSQVEPIKGLRIDLTATRMFSKNTSQYYVYNQDSSSFGESFFERNGQITGNFNMSYFTWNTAFVKRKDGNDYSSVIFDAFRENRIVIADRLALIRSENQDQTSPYQYDPDLRDDEGFPDGYNSTSQDVLIPAFLAAYGGKDAKSVSLSPMPSIPLPNWRITYDGLAKIKLVKRFVKTASINHSYRSSYAINSYTTNMYWNKGTDGLNWVRDNLSVYSSDTTNSNFLAGYEINGVSINEQMSPLIGLDLTWNNSLITKVEIKKTRNINLNFSNNQITEVTGDEIIIGSGYRFNKVPITFKSLTGNKTRFESDLNLRIDLSIRKNLTIIRKIVENYDDLTAGTTVTTLKISADYVLSDRFNIRLFFDKIVNKPHISITFPTSNTNFGISVRFTLAG